VMLSDAGRDAVRDAPDALQQRYVRAFERLADWEQMQILAALERVAAMLDADALDVAPVLDSDDIRAVK